MTDEGIQRWRRKRLKALADKLGGNATLGRKLGYRDGAFVGQMLKGLRPITEKTVQAAEAIRDEALGPSGARGWFSADPTPSAAPAPALELEPHYVQLIADLEDLEPKKRNGFIDMIHEAAEDARAQAAYLAAKQAKETQVAHARRPSPRVTAQVTWGDGNSRQQSLPLATVRDPFSAAPSDRETALYERIGRSPKTRKE